MLKRMNNNGYSWLSSLVRHYSRVLPPRPVSVDKVIRVYNNIARFDVPKDGPKPRQLLSLPPFPSHPLPGKNSTSAPGDRDRVTAVNWIKYYFKGTSGSVIESHFREGLVMSVLMNDGKTERVMLAHHSSIEPHQEAVTEYRVLGPKINGCSWIELRPLTYRKHQLRVHCAEALGTPIVGDYKYGWFVHNRWKQMARVDIEPTTGKRYKLRRPEGLDIQKGSVLSKVPLLHLHCRELALPNIAKFLHVLGKSSEELHPSLSLQPDILRFVATMPNHMRISWNLMSSYLV